MQKWFATLLFILGSITGFSQELDSKIWCGQQLLSDSIRYQNPKIKSIVEDNELQLQNWIIYPKNNPGIQSVE